MLVICAGMYRACSTWQYEVAGRLVSESRGGLSLGYMTGEEFDRSGEVEGWAVLKSHEEHPKFRRLVDRGDAIVLYSYRDLRDVVYSLMHKRRCSFDRTLRLGMIHQVLANDRFWATRPGALIQRYEDLIADPVAGVQEIGRRLGVETTRSQAERVAETFSLEANRARVIRLTESLSEAGIDLDDPTNAQFYDPASLLHWNHLRQGESGSWKREADRDEKRILGRICDPWLARHGYETPTVAADDSTLAESIRDGIRTAQGAVVCYARCLGLKHPKLATTVKRALGIRPTIPAAAAVETSKAPREEAGATS